MAKNYYLQIAVNMKHIQSFYQIRMLWYLTLIENEWLWYSFMLKWTLISSFFGKLFHFFILNNSISDAYKVCDKNVE